MKKNLYMVEVEYKSTTANSGWYIIGVEHGSNRIDKTLRGDVTNYVAHVGTFFGDIIHCITIHVPHTPSAQSIAKKWFTVNGKIEVIDLTV